MGGCVFVCGEGYSKYHRVRTPHFLFHPPPPPPSTHAHKHTYQLGRRLLLEHVDSILGRVGFFQVWGQVPEMLHEAVIVLQIEVPHLVDKIDAGRWWYVVGGWVSIELYTHTHTHASTHTCTHIHARTYTHIHAHTRTQAHAHTRTRAHAHIPAGSGASP